MKQENVLKEKNQITAGLSTIFRAKLPDEDNKEIPESERKMYLDPANVASIIPKNTTFKKLLLDNFDVKEDRCPSLDYNFSKEELKMENSCLYSAEYLQTLINIAKAYDSVKIKIKPQYPLWAETEDFIFILAPRVRND